MCESRGDEVVTTLQLLPIICKVLREPNLKDILSLMRRKSTWFQGWFTSVIVTCRMNCSITGVSKKSKFIQAQTSSLWEQTPLDTQQIYKTLAFRRSSDHSIHISCCCVSFEPKSTMLSPLIHSILFRSSLHMSECCCDICAFLIISSVFKMSPPQNTTKRASLVLIQVPAFVLPCSCSCCHHIGFIIRCLSYWEFGCMFAVILLTNENERAINNQWKNWWMWLSVVEGRGSNPW